MRNFLSRATELKNSLVSKVTTGTNKIIESVKKKVGVLTTAVVLGTSANAMAADWHKVTVPGMGPQAFAEKHFGTKEWQNLVDRKGNSVIVPETDLILGKEYTIKTEGNHLVLEKKQETKKAAKVVETPKVQAVSEKPKKEIKAKVEAPKTVKKIQAKKPTEVSTKKEPSARAIAAREEKIEIAKYENISYEEMMKLPGFDSFNMATYFKAAGEHESAGGNQYARNDKKGIELNENPRKFAFGWPQFTVETLEGYGIHLMNEEGKLVERRIQDFLRNKSLQDELMEDYTKKSLSIIQSNPKVIHRIVNGKVSLPAILAKGHIAGHGSINLNWGGKDWLGTSVKHYAKNIEKSYQNFAKVELAEKEKDIVPEALRQVPTALVAEKVAMFTPANDEFFTSNVSDLSHRVQDRTKQTLRNIQMLAAANKLEKQADRLKADIDMIINNGIGKRKMILEEKKCRQNAEALRRQAQKDSEEFMQKAA